MIYLTQFPKLQNQWFEFRRYKSALILLCGNLWPRAVATYNLLFISPNQAVKKRFCLGQWGNTLHVAELWFALLFSYTGYNHQLCLLLKSVANQILGFWHALHLLRPISEFAIIKRFFWSIQAGRINITGFDVRKPALVFIKV